MQKIDPNKLLSPSKDSKIQKRLDSSILVPFKNVEISSKTISISKLIDKPEKSKDDLESTVIEIKTSVLSIEKILKTNTKLLKKQTRIARKTDQDQKRKEKEERLEKKTKRDKFPNLKKPDLPRTGIVDYIKNFLSWVIIGRAFVLFGKYLPKLVEFLKNLKPLYDLFKVIGGALFNGLVTFVEWTDKAHKKVREIAGSLGGEPFQKAFDDFSGALTTFANLALIAGMATMGGSDLGLGDALDGNRRGGRRGGRVGRGGIPKDNLGRRITSDGFKQGKTLGKGWQGFNLWKQRGTDTNLQTSENDIIKRYTKKYGRKNAINRFGEDRFKSLGGKYARSRATNLARKGAVSLLGKGGAKTALKIARPLVKRLPIVGGLVDFGLSVAFGEPLGRAAFKAIGAGLLGAIGTGFGGPLGAIIGGFAGDWAGGKLYDIFFDNKKGVDKSNPQKKNKGGTIKPKKGKVINRRAKTKSKILSKRLKKISSKKISPGKNLGGKRQVEKLYPNPDSKSFDSSGGFSWMNFLFGGGSKNETEEKKKKRNKRRLRNKNKIPNATKALLGVADRLEKSANWISYLMRAGIEVAMGQMPDVKSLTSVISNVFNNIRNSGASLITKELVGFADGGEISDSNLSSIRYFKEILPLERTIEKDLRTTLQDSLNVVKRETQKRGPTGRDEMLEENRRRGREDDPGAITSLGSGGGSLKDLTDKDYDDLAYIVSGEAARGTDDEYGVAAAVLNRVASPAWPNTIMGVGTQTGQFEAVEKGTARRDPALAKKLKDNQGKIADALNKLNGRDSFKGQSQLDNKGSSDIMFDPRGNFYHYRQQVRKSDPEPANIDQSWKKLIGPSTGGSFSTPSGGQPDQNIPSSVPKGSVAQWLHGNPNRAGYRADHGGQANAHDHFSFKSRQAAVAAFLKLKKAGYQPYEFEGYTSVGKHSPTGGHYGPVGAAPTYGDTSDGTAFDIPWATYGSGPIKQSDYDKSYRAAKIVGAAQGGGPIDMNYKKINNIANSLNSYDDESDVQFIIQPMMINTSQNQFAISTPPRRSGGSINFIGSPSHNLHR